MKKFILFSIFILASATYAQDTAKPDRQELPTPPASTELTAAEFFKLIHPKNKRNPNWPEKLTIEPVTSISQKQFEKEFKGTWRIAYHCNGKPIVYDPNKVDYSLYDGINGGYGTTIISKNNYADFEGDEYEKTKRSGDYILSPQGGGNFYLSFPKKEFSDVTVMLVKIKETNEFGWQHSGSNKKTCPDGIKLQSIYVPIAKPIS